ncbi:hypothetical protein DFJ73DRAFT_780681 [Zopfochytrium polystomum]|nr:hypothetical protein DFJ73DRAFT_780681 [Zopfochytrium polystomum]
MSGLFSLFLRNAIERTAAAADPTAQATSPQSASSSPSAPDGSSDMASRVDSEQRSGTRESMSEDEGNDSDDEFGPPVRDSSAADSDDEDEETSDLTLVFRNLFGASEPPRSPKSFEDRTGTPRPLASSPLLPWGMEDLFSGANETTGQTPQSTAADSERRTTFFPSFGRASGGGADLLFHLLLSLLSRASAEDIGGSLFGDGPESYEEFLRLAELLDAAADDEAVPLHKVEKGKRREETATFADELKDGGDLDSAVPDPTVTVNHSQLPLTAERDADTAPRANETSSFQQTEDVSSVTWGIKDLLAATKEKCTICLCPYEEGESLRIMRCRHGFHAECIDQAARESRPSPATPPTALNSPNTEATPSQPFPMLHFPAALTPAPDQRDRNSSNSGSPPPPPPRRPPTAHLVFPPAAVYTAHVLPAGRGTELCTVGATDAGREQRAAGARSAPAAGAPSSSDEGRIRFWRPLAILKGEWP